MNVAAKVRENREKHPEFYCTQCLWRVVQRDGTKTPCPKHQAPPDNGRAA